MFGKQIKIALAIVTAICAISCASLLIKLTDAPPMTVAFYRVLIATCLYAPFVRTRSGDVVLLRQHKTLMCIGGTCLAAHFGFWISSLSYTSIASSVSLVNTSPIFVALFSRFLRTRDTVKEGLSLWLWIGIALGVVGSAGLAGSDMLNPEKHSFTGDMLALLGAISLAGYLMAGRAVGSSVPLPLYLTCVYGFAAAMLLPVCLMTKSTLVNLPWNTFLMLILIGIVPQGIGHSLVNWTLRYLPAYLVALYIIGEPIGAALLAYFFLGERPSSAEIVCIGLILTGILISQIAFSRRKT
ncbi:MAG: DMT family transporter [Thermodesulforhabdaceae bacterium]